MQGRQPSSLLRISRATERAGKKKSQLKQSKDAKDEIDFATNWDRAYLKIYQEIKWLNAFAIIN